MEKINSDTCIETIKIEILDCLDNADEALVLEKLMDECKFDRLDSIVRDDETSFYTRELRCGNNISTRDLTDELQKLGVPYNMRVGTNIGSCKDIEVFDGVRIHAVPSDEHGNAMVDMRAMGAAITMLQNDEEIRALVYCSENYIETDVSLMFRHGIETERALIKRDPCLLEMKVEEVDNEEKRTT